MTKAHLRGGLRGPDPKTGLKNMKSRSAYFNEIHIPHPEIKKEIFPHPVKINPEI